LIREGVNSDRTATSDSRASPSDIVAAVLDPPSTMIVKRP